MPTFINPHDGTYIVQSDKSPGNDLETLRLDPIASALYVKGSTHISDHLFVGGSLVVNADVISLGNGNGSLAINSNVSSDILPSQTNHFDIGSSNYEWKSIFTNNLHISQSPSVEINQNFSIETSISSITASAQPASVLPDGANGQIKIIVVTQTPTSTVILTPTNANGFSTISFTNVGDSATMLFTNGAWNIVSNFRASVS